MLHLQLQPQREACILLIREMADWVSVPMRSHCYDRKESTARAVAALFANSWWNANLCNCKSAIKRSSFWNMFWLRGRKDTLFFSVFRHEVVLVFVISVEFADTNAKYFYLLWVRTPSHRIKNLQRPSTIRLFCSQVYHQRFPHYWGYVADKLIYQIEVQIKNWVHKLMD